MRRGFLFAYIQVGFDANGHNLGINLFKTAFSPYILPLANPFKNAAQCIRCRRIRRTNHSGIDVCGRRNLRMTQSSRNRCCRDVCRNQQRRIGMAQTMKAARRQVMLPQEFRKPRRNLVRVKRFSVLLGEQQIVLYLLASFHHDFPLPISTHLDALPHLPLLIIPQQFYTVVAQPYAATAFFRFGIVENHSLVRDIRKVSVDCQHTGI